MNNPLPRSLERLIEALSRLPGVGPKTASRLTFHLLRAAEGESQELADALLDLHRSTRECAICFSITAADRDPCIICADADREASTICVVEEPLDVLAIERTGRFSGRYHVLHGAISPVEGVGPEDLRIRELIQRIDGGGVVELIIATNPTLEGEATAKYIKQRLQGVDIRITRLARGLPSGGDLEYADSITLGQALEGRSDL
jgi:recombination protein RecR